jgi:TolB protein
MFCQPCRPPMARRFLVVRSLLFALAVLVTAGACDGRDGPLAPADTPPAPAEEAAIAGDRPVAEDLALASTAPRIAFTSYRNGNGDIYLMDQQGYNLKRLTTAPAAETFPVWSWDNKRIALVRPRKNASNVTHNDIYLINADGTNGHWALSTPSEYDLDYPSWSPDGSRIVVTVTSQGVWFIGYVNVANRYLGFFTSGGVPVRGKQPSYDGTGQRILFVNTKTISYALDVMNADGSGRVTIGSVPGSTLDGPVFSPDGKRIAFANAAGNGDIEIFVKSLVDGSVKRLTYSTGNDFRPTWSPDGSKIVFARSQNGRMQIWRVNATGGSATRLSHNSYEERWPSYSH